MTVGVLLAPGLLVCPKDCGAHAPNVARVKVGQGTSEMHHCPKFAGLTVPLVPEGTRCKIEQLEREDYVGNEDVQIGDDGRVIMSFVTTRDDGQDCTVLAPCARVSRDEYEDIKSEVRRGQ